MLFCKCKEIIFSFVIISLLISCAKEPSTSWRDSELQLIKATQKMYFPDAEKLNDDGSLWLIKYSGAKNGEQSNVGGWLEAEYTGQLLPISGSYIFRTTDSTVARKLGTFEYTTHFAPIFTLDTTTIQVALQEAYRRLHVGDTITIMSASWLAFGTDISDVSLNGEVPLTTNTPIIFSITLKDIVPNPKTRELQMVEDYVAAHPEKEFVKVKDNEGNEFEGFYISYKDTVPLDTLHYAVSEDEISVKCAKFYLQDNFLYDTNIDSIAQLGWAVSIDDTAYYSYIFTEDASNTLEIQAMHIAVRNVAPGSWIEFVFTSDYGYGKNGSQEILARPIYAYTPLRYKMYVKEIKTEE